jgi:hypothetical protein
LPNPKLGFYFLSGSSKIIEPGIDFASFEQGSRMLEQVARYEILGKIGQGSRALVCRAQDIQLQREVAHLNSRFS